MADLKVLGICGSLRKASLNMAALRACSELLPPGMTLQITQHRRPPMFDQDVFDAGMPEPVKRLRGEMTAADGVLLASPEYNFSVSAAAQERDRLGLAPAEPGVPGRSRWRCSRATQGPLGGARVQYDLRRILSQLWAYPAPRPEVFIGHAPSSSPTASSPTRPRASS